MNLLYLAGKDGFFTLGAFGATISITLVGDDIFEFGCKR
jgi:hypothetical protein